LFRPSIVISRVGAKTHSLRPLAPLLPPGPRSRHPRTFISAARSYVPPPPNTPIISSDRPSTEDFHIELAKEAFNPFESRSPFPSTPIFILLKLLHVCPWHSKTISFLSRARLAFFGCYGAWSQIPSGRLEVSDPPTKYNALPYPPPFFGNSLVLKVTNFFLTTSAPTMRHSSRLLPMAVWCLHFSSDMRLTCST